MLEYNVKGEAYTSLNIVINLIDLYSSDLTCNRHCFVVVPFHFHVKTGSEGLL